MPPRSGLRMLIVDDEPGMRHSLSRLMRAWGHVVETAENGLLAVDAAARFRPQCVLMDIRMPQMNGVDAFRRIKEVCPNAFVILMTAYSSGAVTAEAHAEGAVDVLAKPLELDRLSALIERAVAFQPVLVIDDDSAFCRSLERVLAQHGFDVQVATSVDDAISAFRRRPRGIVIVDMHLNGRTGLDVMRELRSRNPDIAVVLVSGHDELHEQMQAAAARGAASWLTKPLDFGRLLKLIGAAS